jgi:hypothetical protein
MKSNRSRRGLAAASESGIRRILPERRAVGEFTARRRL